MNDIYKSYIRWRARPISSTDPQTDDQFCLKYNVTKKDLISFIEKPEYQDDLLLASLSWAKSKTPELLHIVYNEVKLNKSVADLDRFIQLAHEIKRKDKETKSTTNFNFFTNLKPEQYANIIRREAESLSERGAEETPELLSVN